MISVSFSLTILSGSDSKIEGANKFLFEDNQPIYAKIILEEIEIIEE